MAAHPALIPTSVPALLNILDESIMATPAEKRQVALDRLLVGVRQMPGVTNTLFVKIRKHTMLCEYCCTFLGSTEHPRRCAESREQAHRLSAAPHCPMDEDK